MEVRGIVLETNPLGGCHTAGNPPDRRHRVGQNQEEANGRDEDLSGGGPGAAGCRRRCRRGAAEGRRDQILPGKSSGANDRRR